MRLCARIVIALLPRYWLCCSAFLTSSQPFSGDKFGEKPETISLVGC
jgi:hypothetical protein